jgi:glycosyltransferase involved in cell wall biosynthesis/GT2 family glycosyltransferase
MERLSILVANRNTLPFLKLCLKSLRHNLRRRDNRILVLDDASTDGSAEWLAENSGRYGCEVEFHRGPQRLGIVGAYNRLVDAAETEAVFLVHTDMYFALGADEETARYLAPAAACTCTRVEPPLYPQTARTIVADLGFGAEDFREEEFLRFAASSARPGRCTEGIFAPLMCFKEDLLAVGGLDPAFAPQSQEDSDLFNRMAVAGYRFRQSWSAFCYHFSGRGSRKKDGTEGDSEEWQASNRKNERNFIRRWGCGVRTDALLKPIVPPKEPISLATLVSGERPEDIISFLTEMEPYFDEIALVVTSRGTEVVQAVGNYVRREALAGPTLLKGGKFRIVELAPECDPAGWRGFALEQATSDWVFVASLDERFDRAVLEHLQDIAYAMRGTGKTVCGFLDAEEARQRSAEMVYDAGGAHDAGLRPFEGSPARAWARLPHFRLLRRGVRYDRQQPDLPDPVGRSPEQVVVWPHGGMQSAKAQPRKSAQGGGMHAGAAEGPLSAPSRGLRRIAIDVRTVEPHMHGIGVYAHRLVNALAREAPELDIAVLTGGEGLRMFGGVPPNVHVVECPARLGDRRWEEGAGERWCLENGIDLYHGTSYGCIASEKLATIATVHDVSFLTHPEFYDAAFIRHMEGELLHTLRHAGRIIAVSRHVAGILQERFGLPASRLDAVHSGPGQIDRPVHAEAQRRYVLAMDLGQPRKNAEGVIRAFARLLDRAGFAGNLLFVERGWHVRPDMEALCRRLGIAGRVEVTGELDAEGLRRAYCGAVCLVYPSCDEGFGFPPLEAMQCGTPVIVSRAGSLPEICGDAALYVGPDDVGAIAEAMSRLIGDPNLAAQMREKGFGRAGAFSWVRCAMETLSAYARANEVVPRPQEALTRASVRPHAQGGIGMVTTWNVPCGVAESTRPLVDSLREKQRVCVLSEKHEGGSERDEVQCWRRGGDPAGIARTAQEQGCSAVHLQYHPAFFYDADAFVQLLWDLKLSGIGTVVSLHEIAASPPVWALVPDALIVHSRAMADFLRRGNITTPTATIPLSMKPVPDSPDTRPRATGAAERVVLKTVGFLHPDRGHRWGLEVVAALKDEVDLDYQVVGALARGCEGYPEELRAYARQLGVADRFRLRVGYVPDGQLIPEWASADVGLLPYAYHGIGSSAAALDALSADIPVVARRSVFFDGLDGAVLQVTDSAEMARAVRHILQDKGVPEGLGRGRQALQDDRTSELRAERHERVYAQVGARQARLRRTALDPWLSLHIVAKETTPLGLEFFRSCLRSLVDYADEFIIVDNGCSGNVLAMVNEELRGRMFRVLPALGVRDFSLLRNMALENTSRPATHIHWVDTDEIFFPSQLLRLKEALRDPDIAVMHVLLVHFMREPTLVQDVQVNRCIFRRTAGLRWRGVVHEVVEGAAKGRTSFMPARFLHFGYCRPQWETCLKWLQYAALEYGSLDRYRWEMVGGERRAWFGERRSPDTIVEDREVGPYEGKYPPSCAPWLEAWHHSGLPWRDFLKTMVDHTPWEEWQRLARESGSWEATLEEMLAAATAGPVPEGVTPSGRS